MKKVVKKASQVKVKITNKMLMVDFEFPITVGQVKIIAIGQAHVYKGDQSGQIEADFDFMDYGKTTYMGMTVEGYDGVKKLKEMHKGFGIDLDTLIDNEFNKVVTEEFKANFLKQFDIKMFE
jgi:hypothetical protein